uniref:Uncharacterized protein n=1 Tax=Anguilla anguilla TaxID=7936 RepID=A0A0E9Y0C1_ANGAN
MYEVPFNHC